MVRRFLGGHGLRPLPTLAVLSLVTAAVIGQLAGGANSVEKYLPQSFPGSPSFELLSREPAYDGYLYGVTGADDKPVGYVTATEGQGYGGPMTVMVAWSLNGTILKVAVPEHLEDMPWFRVLARKGFFRQYVDRQYSEPLRLDEDINAVTGSTVSSVGVAMGVRMGRQMLSGQLGDPYPYPREPIDFGLAEVLLLLGLGAVVLIRTVPTLRRKRRLRYLMLAFGLVVLGIWLAIPLSLTNFAAFMLGYGPHFSTNVIMYILVFGVVGLAVFLGKNYYCFWLCPFAAVQEGLCLFSGSRAQPATRWRRGLRNIRYFLLWLALLFVLLLRNPTVSVFEPWNVLFSLEGTGDQWLLMLLSLFVAMFIYDFWCYYLCPVGAVMDIILKVRKGVTALWDRKIRPRLTWAA